MTESFLQFIWKNKLFSQQDLVSDAGDIIEILDTGEQNLNAGPDFYNVKVKIGSTVWVGCAEVHVKSSDWFKHKHDKDKAYNNVVLHIVKQNDTEVKRQSGEVIPAIELDFNPRYFQSYQDLYWNNKWLSCQDKIKTIDPFILRQWLGRVLVERLKKKANYIEKILKSNKNNWNDTFYQLLARNFGLNVNALPFEMLAKSMPLKILAKHKDSLLQIEALVFGQAGFLHDNINQEGYYRALKKEYDFLKIKYKLKPLEKHLWKFLRLRPNNFPTIRIAQFAMLIYQSSSLFSKILKCKKYEDCRDLFAVATSDYWKEHYTFGKRTKKHRKTLGKSTIDVFLINTVAPVLFVYGKKKGIQEYMDKSLHLLESIKPEINSIIKKWDDRGIKAENAFYSQALLQLRNEYCKCKKCLYCQVGNSIIIAGIT